MKALFLIGIILISSISACEDRECGQDLSNLWLDLVVVVDNSNGMTNIGLTQVATDVSSIFMNGTRIGSNYSDPRSTRVGIVTYNKDATIVADLETYQSVDHLLQGSYQALGSVSTKTESTLQKGIAEAEKVLRLGRQGVRTNYQQAVIIYASAYSGSGENDPKTAADRLKASGVTVITVAFNQDGNRYLLENLAKIASPAFNFSSHDADLVGRNSKINCFCPDSWVQCRANYHNRASHKYGVCVKTSGLPAAWNAAKYACQNFGKDGFLVSEFNQQKHDFVYEVVKNDTNIAYPHKYLIGLSKTNDVWSWQQSSELRGYSKWNPGFPTNISSDIAVMNVQNSVEVGWQNINPNTVAVNYVCESRTCDTDNYCS